MEVAIEVFAERENDQSFTIEEFLKQNKEGVRSIMSEFGLVPSRHETILKVAGIISSGVFAGLSLLVPGLSLAGFSLYGFSPMIKHLGGKIDGQGIGSTTTMRAALQNARQSEMSKDIDVKIGKQMEAKSSPVDIEVRYLFDPAPTVESINQFSHSRSAVEYLVNTKAKDFDANIYYALESQTQTQTFYDPSLIVKNLEAQLETLKYRKETIDLLSKAKEINSNFEAKMAENPEKVSVIIESESLIPQQDSGNGLHVWVHMVGSSGEKMIILPRGANSEEINAEIHRQLKVSRDTGELRIFYKKDGELTSLVNEPDVIIDDIIATTSRLNVVPEMAMHHGQSISLGDEIIEIPTWLFDENFDWQTNYEIQLYQDKYYRGAIRFLSNKFEGVGNIIENFNTMDKVKALSKVFEVIVGIGRKITLSMPESLNSKNIGVWFDQKFFGKVSSSDIVQTLKEKGAVDEDIWRWEDHWRNYFDSRFEVGFETAPNGNTESYIGYIKNFALYNVIFEKILESYVIEGETIPIEDLPAAFDKFLRTYSDDFNQKYFRSFENEIVEFFTDSKGINKIFMKLSESFFDDVRNDFMSFSRSASAFIGDILESSIFMSELFKIVATKYADSGFAGFSLFSWAEFNPKAPLRGDFNKLIGGQERLVDIFEILDNGIAPEDAGPINARLYDLLVAEFPDLVISFHAKYSRNPKKLKIQDLAADELSTILIDLLLHIRKALDTSSLSVPIKKHISFNYQVSISSEFEASEIFKTKFQMKNMVDLQHADGSMKSILTSIYRNRVAELINSYLRKDTSLTTPQATIERILGIFDDWIQLDDMFPEIPEILIDLAKNTFKGKPVTNEYIKNVIKTFTNEENLRNMLQKTSSGTYELVKYSVIDFLFDSGEALTFDNIPQNLFTLGRNGKVPLTRERFGNFLRQKRPLVVVRDINTGEIGVVASRFVNDFPEYIKEGYAYFDENINEEVVINNVYLNNPKGNRLIGKVAFNEFGFSIRDGGEEWFMRYTNIQFIDGAFQMNYYRALGWGTGNRFIAFLQEVEDNIRTIPPYQSQITVDKTKESPQWLRDINLQKEENSFLDPDFSSHVNHDSIVEDAERFLDKLSILTDLYAETSDQYQFLPIDNYDLQILGAYEDEIGRLILGPDYDDIEFSFRTLVSNYISRLGLGFFQFNEIALKLSSLKKMNPDDPINIQTITFDNSQTRKEFLQNWIDIFRQYQFTDSNSKLIKKMNDVIVDRENSFYGISNEFDLGRDNEKFDKREILLANRVVKVLTELFGNYMFKEMFSGGVLVKDGTVRFMSQPKKSLFATNKAINAVFSKNTYYTRGADIRLKKYIIDKFTSSYDITLPTDGTIEISDAIISLSEVPVKLVLPIYKRPSDEKSLFDFYKKISYEIYNHYETLNHFKKEALVKSWKSQFFKTLIEMCKDRGYDALQLSLLDEGLRYKFFAERASARELREKTFDWLTSRGEYSITLTHNKGELKITPDDFNRYFKKDWAKFALSLYIKTKYDSSVMESDLRYMQDFIVNTINFIFELAENSVNKRIDLHPQTAFENGFSIGYSPNKYLPSGSTDLDVWSLSKGAVLRLDLNDPKSIIDFIDNIPILLGNLLVRPASFIVRDPDYPGLEDDQCSFVFGMIGSLLPSQMKGSSSYQGPPSTGMRWAGGNEVNYKKSSSYLKWNEIISRHDTLSLHKYRDPNKFYEIVRRILFTTFDDIIFYL